VADLYADMFLSVDGSTLGTRSPGYFGYFGPDLERWIAAEQARARRDIMGRITYEILADLPVQARDASWERMTTRPTIVFSRSLTKLEWPGAELIAEDAVDAVRRLKQTSAEELRTVGSVSLVQQLLAAGLVDHLRLMVFPLVVAETGKRPLFEAVGDFELQLESQTVLDDRIVLLEYRPGGKPPYAG
jgi:dihydrofolate reductase